MDADDHRHVLLTKLQELLDAGIAEVRYAQPVSPPAGPYQSHAVPRMTVVTAGRKHIAYNDGERSLDEHLPARTAMFMPPLGWTQPRYDSPREIFGVVFNRDYTRYLWGHHDGKSLPRAPDAYLHAPITMQGAAAHLLQALCVRAKEVRGRPSSETDRLLFLAMVRIALERLEHAPSERSGRARATWQSLREYVIEHFHRPISRDSTAAAFRLHPNYLSTLFVEQGGESFAHFLIRMRMERAAELLQSGTMSVAAVGAACGYQDPGYFIKAFRRFHRTTPGRFRRDA